MIFLTSYTHINDFYRQIYEEGLRFDKAEIYIEVKDHQTSMESYEKYKDHVRKHNKGIFMCVSRGKLSEGLNFKDNLARACLVVGIPYLLVNSARVNLKKAYLDKVCKEKEDPETLNVGH